MTSPPSWGALAGGGVGLPGASEACAGAGSAGDGPCPELGARLAVGSGEGVGEGDGSGDGLGDGSVDGPADGTVPPAGAGAPEAGVVGGAGAVPEGLAGFLPVLTLSAGDASDLPGPLLARVPA